MFCGDHVECVVGFHKVCRMIVPSVLEVMMGLQLFAILSGFVQKYTLWIPDCPFVYTFWCEFVNSCEWWIHDILKVVWIGEGWWRRTVLFCWGEARFFPGCQINACNLEFWRKRMLMMFLRREEHLIILYSFHHYICWKVLSHEWPLLAHQVTESKSGEIQHGLCRSCYMYSGISQGRQDDCPFLRFGSADRAPAIRHS